MPLDWGLTMLRTLSIVLALTTASCLTTSTTQGDNPSADELLARADGFFDSRQLGNALETYKMAAVAARTEGDEALFAEAAAQVAHTLALSGEVEEGRSWLDHAEKTASAEYPAAWARTLLARGAIQRGADESEAALESFTAAYEFALETGQPVRAVQAAYMAGVVAEDELQIRWNHKALDLARGMGNPRLVSSLWAQLAWLLEERELADEALAAFASARKALEDLDDPHRILVADWSYAHGLRMVGRLADARLLMLDVGERAERSYVAMQRPNDAEWVARSLRELGELDLADGDALLALARFEQARDRFLVAGITKSAPESLAEFDRRLRQIRKLAAEQDAREKAAREPEDDSVPAEDSDSGDDSDRADDSESDG